MRGARMLAMFLAVFGVAALSNSQDRASREFETLEGTWIVDITPTGQATRQILTTFARGGTVTGNGNNPMPTLRSPWQGVWTRVTYRDFVATLERWNFDAAGNPTGKTELRQVIVVDPSLNQFTGRSKTLVFDVAGNLTSTTDATFRATRSQVKPVD